MVGRSCLAGMEVPIIGSDSIKWFQVSVPSNSSSSASSTSAPATTLSRDFASCSAIGNPPTYLIWKTSKGQPNVLEILEVYGDKEFPKIGLQISFPDALFPFVYIQQDESNFGSEKTYLLYTVTVNGVAFLVKLKGLHKYASSSVVASNEVVEYNTQANPQCGVITAAAASSRCLIVGRNDGSIGCFQLGLLDATAPGFMWELRDDAGFGRLWGIVSRSRISAPVQDLAVVEVHQRKLIFVLHSDGIFRAWDLANRSKIFSHAITVPTVTGTIFLKLWVGDDNRAMNIIPLAILHKNSMEVEMISFYGLNLGFGDKMIFTLEPLITDITLEEGGPVDVILTSDKVWILKEDGLLMQELFCQKEAVTHSYGLQEAFVADQLFQSSEHFADEILWLAHTVFSSSKDQISQIVSSIFLHRLLLPGVYHSTVLRTTLQYYNKHFTDSEFDSFTMDGLKNEIQSLIENEGCSGSPLPVLQWWKTFCAQYSHNWCKTNAVCGLFLDSSTGAVGLIRKNMFSLCRMLEDIELFIYGSFDESGNSTSSGAEFSNDELDREILFGVLQCISSVSQQLGKAASAIFYESLRSTPNISCEEVLPCLLKILETGYSASIVSVHVSEIGADIAWEKEAANHKNLRKFSMDLFLSLHALRSRATSWGRVLDVIQSYLRFLVPRKIVHKMDFQAILNVNIFAAVQATSQVAKVMFESALELLVLLTYMVNLNGKIHMSHDDASRIKLELVPMIQEILTEWHIIHFVVTTPTEAPVLEDFSYQLSSLHIDNKIDRRSLNDKLGKCDFTLGFILLLNLRSSSGDQRHLSSRNLSDCCSITNLVREFTSWIIWGSSGEESSVFFIHLIELAFIFLRHGQYNALEYLLKLVDAYSRKQKICESLQSADGEWPTLLHLLGCCLIQQTQRGLHRMLKERKISEAVYCFYRAASVQGAPDALQSLPQEAGLAYLGFTGCSSDALWKLHYYQWAMQIFERYNISEAACNFALAALEQVDEALGSKDDSSGQDPLDESATVVKGRLWANVFKFTLDLNFYHDAYCAIISNPDEESKNICLRRFIIVLLERGAVKILCDGQLPFIGLVEKVEKELAWKAARSDILANPNPLKLLYAFEVHRQNWRKAASFIYLHSTQLKTEAANKDNQHRSFALQERLNGLSAAINALQLVHPAYAWIDSLHEESTHKKEHYPSKKARITRHEQAPADVDGPQHLYSFLEIEEIENEYVITSAEYLLSLANIKWTFTGDDKPPENLVDLLVEANLYDMAFTVVLRFWKDSGLKKELERVFAAMSLKCCPTGINPSLFGNHRMQGFLLTSSQEEESLLDMGAIAQQSKGNSQWETLEVYLGKYKQYNSRLPIVVAETLLASDPQIVLPLWLVQLFKVSRQEYGFGMIGSESSPASLFRLYVDYGRYVEATNVLLEYIESLASLRPADIIRRKRQCAVWFPYTTIERLWCQLEESIRLGHMVDQSEKLKKLLHGALLKHLNLIKVDSDDVQSFTV
ncbi:nuclear pore complex protein NUP160 [Coffea arabica]|uniref:Nuclear pore complex protein NUP160 n=1 Tax=Coffea arabica TaxID=13443 RepID=A0A6P6VZS2_COFAR